MVETSTQDLYKKKKKRPGSMAPSKGASRNVSRHLRNSAWLTYSHFRTFTLAVSSLKGLLSTFVIQLMCLPHDSEFKLDVSLLI